MASRPASTTKLDLRLSPQAKQLLSKAAEAAHRSVSQFVLESALERAGETLPDRQRFDLDASQWEAFMAALDAPTGEHAGLRHLLQTPSVFESNGPE